MPSPMIASSADGRNIGATASDRIFRNYDEIQKMKQRVYFPPSEYKYTENDQTFTPPDDDFVSPDDETFDTITEIWANTPDKKKWAIGFSGDTPTRLILPDGTSVALTDWP